MVDMKLTLESMEITLARVMATADAPANRKPRQRALRDQVHVGLLLLFKQRDPPVVALSEVVLHVLKRRPSALCGRVQNNARPICCPCPPPPPSPPPPAQWPAAAVARDNRTDGGKSPSPRCVFPRFPCAFPSPSRSPIFCAIAKCYVWHAIAARKSPRP